MWNRSGFLCKNPKFPGAQGRRPLRQSHLSGAVFKYATLAVAPTGIVLVYSVLIKHNQNQLTCDKDPNIRQTSRPKTARTKLPKGPKRRDEGDFLTLQEGSRKGFSPVFPRALAGA